MAQGSARVRPPSQKMPMTLSSGHACVVLVFLSSKLNSGKQSPLIEGRRIPSWCEIPPGALRLRWAELPGLIGSRALPVEGLLRVPGSRPAVLLLVHEGGGESGISSNDCDVPGRGSHF